MKARYKPNLTRKEMEILEEAMQKDFKKAVMKAQWLLLVALNEACGLGEKRIARTLREYLPKIIDEYGGYKADDVADEILERRIKQILPNTFTGLYK